jgi:hypothetical protein
MTKPTRTKFDDKSGGNVTKDGDKPTLWEQADRAARYYAEKLSDPMEPLGFEIAAVDFKAGALFGIRLALDRAVSIVHGMDKSGQSGHAKRDWEIAQAIRAEKERV